MTKMKSYGNSFCTLGSTGLLLLLYDII